MLITSDEREMLNAFLDDQRGNLLKAVQGMSDAEARRRLVPSRTTLLGLLRHGAAVERFFFQRTLAGLTIDEINGLSDATAASWQLPADLSMEQALDDFLVACDHSREIAARYPLSFVSGHNKLRGPMTLRWIYLRMIEEHATHAGHAAILREQLLMQRGATSSRY